MPKKATLSSEHLQELAGEIPEEYVILEHLLEFKTDYWCPEVPVLVLSPDARDVAEWYNDFERVIFETSKAKKFLPILRASDGEFRFLLGPQPPSRRENSLNRMKSYSKYFGKKLLSGVSGFRGQTAPGISVGNYSRSDIVEGRRIFIQGIKFVCKHGFFAAHLQFAPKPFQEIYHAPLKRVLDQQEVIIKNNNYVPFYFVYQLLGRIATDGLLKGKRVLFINGADREKRERIDSRFDTYGVREARWIKLTKNRSLFDQIELSAHDMEMDVCILGGGIGKFNLIQQLVDFPGPVIDAGYYFEAWANPDLAGKRPLCIV